MTNITKGFTEYLGDRTRFTRKEYIDWAESNGFTHGKRSHWLRANATKTGERGVWDLSLQAGAPTKKNKASKKASVSNVVAIEKKAEVHASVASILNEDVYVPVKVKEFVKWGHTKDVETILKSGIFFPIFVTGLTGNGKTMMVEQACANANRQYIRVQITPETDEDDLIGGFRLVNGETVFAKGPVIKAMEAGAVLLIDEIDRGSNKLMALQGVLEGKPVLIKKTGELISPAEGFTVVATANTKGRGDDEGRYISATIIDEAFLERFNITLEQPYPTASIEKKIVLNHMVKYSGEVDDDYAERLVKWAGAIRKTYLDGGVDDFISTRRLTHIVHTFSIFKDRMKAIELCVNRYDSETREAFLDLYTNLDDTILEEIENSLEEGVEHKDGFDDAAIVSN